MKTLTHVGFSLVLIFCAVTARAATLGGYTDKTDICAEEKQTGVTAGDAAGYARGLGEGTTLGTAQGIAQCFADPQSCNITLASCIPAAVYGETEPNDNMIAADPLQLGVYFWGQNYQADDQDWFYTETMAANQNMLITLKVPGGEMKGWLITIRDAAGNVFASFDSSIPGEVPTIADDEATTYRVTLGLVGTYYIMVQPIPTYYNNGDIAAISPNYKPYAISVILQDSTLNTGSQPIVGFSDTEVEPNDVPSKANWLASSVSMYGLVNLMFNGVVTDGTDSVWGQGEDDWYVFNSHGNELLTLTFCAKQLCGPGSWFVEVYDEVTAQRVEAGELRENVLPLLAFNTDTGDMGSVTYRLGLKNAGKYYMRVDHKRLFDAPCAWYQTDINGDGTYDQSCSCEDKNSCKTDIPNPASLIDMLSYPSCPGSDEKTATCRVNCNCEATDVNGEPIGCITEGHDPVQCSCPFNLKSCEITIDNPGVQSVVKQYPTCPDGTGGGDTTTCSVNCQCTQFGGVVEIPAEAITSQYNFTWFSTQVPPNTYDTDAYQEFLNRSNPYQ